VPEGAGKARPGRPSTGARERILEGALGVLKADGYAGMTTAKVAARSGENKALIGYHFGSKQGLVAAAAREVSAAMTDELLAGIGSPASIEELARGLVDGLSRITDRDAGLPRLYFDLASQSVADPEVRSIMTEMRHGYRDVLGGLLLDLGVKRGEAEAVAVYLIACLEGLALDQLERGDSPALQRAQELFVRSAAPLGPRPPARGGYRIGR
jgi:AcrR family transcriptional regulator